MPVIFYNSVPLRDNEASGLTSKEKISSLNRDETDIMNYFMELIGIFYGTDINWI